MNEQRLAQWIAREIILPHNLHRAWILFPEPVWLWQRGFLHIFYVPLQLIHQKLRTTYRTRSLRLLRSVYLLESLHELPVNCFLELLLQKYDWEINHCWYRIGSSW